jgi:phytoene dehydrogenase-like protein
MTENQYDAIVIGAGHNGLVTAGYQAKEGLSVLVLERRLDKIGGGATTDEDFLGRNIDARVSTRGYARTSPGASPGVIGEPGLTAPTPTGAPPAVTVG